MSERVHILATVRKRNLLPAATLVFDTLRVGFPTAGVTVHPNWCMDDELGALDLCCQRVGATLGGKVFTQHDHWVAKLLETEHDPFWVVDTDTVFFGSLEGLCLPHLAGEWQPAWRDEYTRTVHVERLHTAAMWIRPIDVRDRVREWVSRYPDPEPFRVNRVLVHQHYVPRINDVLFYDTAAGLYHAIGGARLDAFTLERFEHLNCATYADLVGPHLKDAPGLAAMHARVFDDPNAARGIRAQQQEYYAQHPVN